MVAAEQAPVTQIERPNAIVHDASSYRLPESLLRITVVITHHSSLSKEAATYGVPTFFLMDQESRRCYPDLYASGMAHAVDAEDLIAAIAALPAKAAA